MRPDYAISDKRYLSAFNKISSKRIDFVICDPHADFEIACLVELDDRSHHADRDRRRDEATSSAGYCTLRFPSARKPSVDDIRAAFVVLRKRQRGSAAKFREHTSKRASANAR